MEVDEECRQAVAKLSDREREVLIYTSKGLTALEIAPHLGISKHTVRDFRKRIHTKLDVSSSEEAAVIAAKAGVV